jgi:hypothetical protein
MSRLLAMLNRRRAAHPPVVLLAACTPATMCSRPVHAPAVSQEPSCPAVLIRIGDRGRLAQLIDWLLLPFARARAERLLVRQGVASPVAVYALAPDCEAPTWCYRLDSAAASYAHTHLVPQGTGWRAVRRAVRWWTGCDPLVAGLLLVGER